VVGELRVPGAVAQVELSIIVLMFYRPVSNTISPLVPVPLVMLFLLPMRECPGQHKKEMIPSST
jgi:hypothetical protein